MISKNTASLPIYTNNNISSHLIPLLILDSSTRRLSLSLELNRFINLGKLIVLLSTCLSMSSKEGIRFRVPLHFPRIL